MPTNDPDNIPPADDLPFEVEAPLGEFWERLDIEWIDVPRQFLGWDRVTNAQLLAALETGAVDERLLAFAGRFISDTFWHRSLGKFDVDERGVDLVEKFVEQSERQA